MDRYCSSLGVRSQVQLTESASKGQLTQSADNRGIVYQKQRGVVKCRGREKDGEKLEQKER